MGFTYDEPLLTAKQIGRALGVTRHSVFRWVREGKLTAPNVVEKGKPWRWTIGAVEAYLSGRARRVQGQLDELALDYEHMAAAARRQYEHAAAAGRQQLDRMPEYRRALNAYARSRNG